jgi:hypothetical protein
VWLSRHQGWPEQIQTRSLGAAEIIFSFHIFEVQRELEYVLILDVALGGKQGPTGKRCQRKAGRPQQGMSS